MIRGGIDIGGTFTDIVYIDDETGEITSHKILTTPDNPSIAVLNGILESNVDLNQLIRKTGMESLSVIPAGIPPKNPSELLSSEIMNRMVEEIVSRYHDRLVIFDSPPGQSASETSILAQLVDKVVLVVRWGTAAREQVKKFVQIIGRDKILGVVFNAFEMTILDEKMQGEGYYKYYSEGY